jgi:hypothetical protein
VSSGVSKRFDLWSQQVLADLWIALCRLQSRQDALLPSDFLQAHSKRDFVRGNNLQSFFFHQSLTKFQVASCKKIHMSDSGNPRHQSSTSWQVRNLAFLRYS